MIGDGKAGLQSIKQNNFDVSLVGITYMIKVTLSMAIGSYGWRNVSGAYPVLCCCFELLIRTHFLITVLYFGKQCL